MSQCLSLLEIYVGIFMHEYFAGLNGCDCFYTKSITVKTATSHKAPWNSCSRVCWGRLSDSIFPFRSVIAIAESPIDTQQNEEKEVILACGLGKTNTTGPERISMIPDRHRHFQSVLSMSLVHAVYTWKRRVLFRGSCCNATSRAHPRSRAGIMISVQERCKCVFMFVLI